MRTRVESGDQKTEVEPVGQRPPLELKAWRTLVETKGWRAKVKLKSRKFMAGPEESTDHDGARRIRRSQRSVVCARSGSISQLTRSTRTGTDSGMKSVAESVIFFFKYFLHLPNSEGDPVSCNASCKLTESPWRTIDGQH